MRLFLLSICALLSLTLFADSAHESASTEWQSLCNEHRVKNWCIEAVTSTEALETNEKETILPMLHLFETRGENGRFDRKTSQVRMRIEQDILQDLEKIMENKPLDTPVRLLSFGCTGLLQDWYLICQLIRQGKTNIDLCIVDPNLFKESCDGFLEFCEALERRNQNQSFLIHFLRFMHKSTKIPIPCHVCY